jgi:hypothetical protein
MLREKRRIVTLQHTPAQQSVLAITNIPPTISGVTLNDDYDNLRYIVGEEPINEFVGYEDHIAWSKDGEWYFDKPEDGWRVWVYFEYPEDHGLMITGYTRDEIIETGITETGFVDCEYIYQIEPTGTTISWQKSITTTTIRHLEEELEPTHIVVRNYNKTIGYADPSLIKGPTGDVGETGYTGPTGDTGDIGLTGDVGNFYDYPVKIPFIDEDIFAIEDSEDNYERKKTQIF